MPNRTLFGTHFLLQVVFQNLFPLTHLSWTKVTPKKFESAHTSGCSQLRLPLCPARSCAIPVSHTWHRYFWAHSCPSTLLWCCSPQGIPACWRLRPTCPPCTRVLALSLTQELTQARAGSPTPASPSRDFLPWGDRHAGPPSCQVWPVMHRGTSRTGVTRGSCPHPRWPVFVENLLFHSPLWGATLSPFPRTTPNFHTELILFLSGLFPPFRTSHKGGWLDLEWGKEKDAKTSEKNPFKSSFFLFRKQLIIHLSHLQQFSVCS